MTTALSGSTTGAAKARGDNRRLKEKVPTIAFRIAEPFTESIAGIGLFSATR